MSDIGGGGVDFDADTLDVTSSAGPAPVDPDSGAPIAGGFERYAPGELLGAGGMGEVRRYADTTIGRDVAVKIARDVGGDARDEVRRRFEREARVQGQLEHPSIVPVYDLGTRADGVPYFTMKRVKGKTLEEIIAGLRAGDEEIAAGFSRHRLLGAFGSACLAVAYANARGVIHRDLKPANIILGDFGEVYVLDWGIAKVSGEVAAAPVLESEVAGPEQETQMGSLLGTPGYMAPEQVRARGDIDARTDVYALGMILFELLALERFHRGKTVETILIATLEAGPARPRERAPDRDVPPELDELCARATAPDPDDRFDDARELHGELQRYLAGERDAQQRRALADRHVAAAAASLEVGRGDPERDIAERSRAIRELIAAFALDPDSPGARQAMIQALGETGGELPERALEELEDLRSSQRRRAARNATLGLVCLYALLPLIWWNGIGERWAMTSIVAMLTASTIASFSISRARRIPPSYYVGLMVLLGGLIAATATLFGPFFLTPALALGCCAALIAGARIAMRWRALVIAIGITAVLLPALAQWARSAWSYGFAADGALRVLPVAIELGGERTLVVLAAMAVAAVLLPSMLIGRSVDVLHRAEEQQFAQAWRLRQIFPEEVARDAQAS